VFERASPDGAGGTAGRVGVVLGSQDATPLEFWVGAEEGQTVELDDLVVCAARAPDGETVRFYGVVDVVRKRYEGAQFDGDAFRVEAGMLPAEVSYAAHVHVTRIDPERFLPPHPGAPVRIAAGPDLEHALYFDRMPARLPIGLTRGGDPLYANLEFLDGTRGAHASISGVSGVATKTTYAMFLLYALFHSGVLAADAANTRAVVINVKGEDLLWLDHPNAKLSATDRALYEAIGLPVAPFQDVGIYAPARPGSAAVVPHTGSRHVGVRPYLWTLREFARDRLLPFCFAEADDARSQIGYAVERVTGYLADLAQRGSADDPGLDGGGRPLRTLDDVAQHLEQSGQLGELISSPPTREAFLRRLHAACARMGHLVRGTEAPDRWAIRWDRHRVTVVDIHTLHSVGQMFVVGVLLKRMMAHKEQQGSARPLVFVVLDELNKYAPREGWSPIKDVVLDIAERGRSLGISLFGAQQTASEVAPRVQANAALKVVGRLDAAEAEHSEYGFLTPVARRRAAFLQPGAMIVTQPEIPSPLLVRFPFPAWATRVSEVPAGTAAGRDPFARF